MKPAENGVEEGDSGECASVRPQHGFRCGLDAGHGGEHDALAVAFRNQRPTPRAVAALSPGERAKPQTYAQSRQGGRVIPYVACWSSEEPEDVRPEPLLGGMLALFSGGGMGEGRPVLGKLHEGRQREVVVRRLCQVCRAPIPHGGIIMGAHDWTNAAGKHAPLYTEPPACLRCAALALTHCPGLRRQREAGPLPVYRVREYAFVLQMVGRNFPEPLQSKMPPQGAVAYIKMALARYTASTPEQVVRAAASVKTLTG